MANHPEQQGAAMPPPDDRSIELRVEHTRQLFHTLDPFPFPERDLDKDAEEFIVSWARELPRNGPIRIVVHLPAEEARSTEAQGLDKSIQSYFHGRVRAVSLDLKERFRIGRLSLVIGIGVLALCMLASQAVRRNPAFGSMAPFLEESLVLLGWVANWRPIEIFLYDWWPIVQHRNLLRRLSKAEVRTVPDGDGSVENASCRQRQDSRGAARPERW